MAELYYEEVIERAGPAPHHVAISNIRLATEAEILEAQELHKNGKCPHNIIIDSEGFAYDLRKCATCGIFLGFV